MKKLYFLMVLFAFVSIRLQGQTILSENFDNGLPEGWITYDADGDGNTWAWISESEYEGGYMYSPAGFSDNWLISPPFILTGTPMLEFDLKAHNYGYQENGWGVYISNNGGTSPDDFQPLLDPADAWNLNDYLVGGRNSIYGYDNQEVRIAFRYFSKAGSQVYAGMDLDRVKIYETCDLIVSCTVDANSQLREGSWLEIYTGPNHSGEWVDGFGSWYYSENMNLTVPKNVPLFFTWEDPDENRNSWLIIYDPQKDDTVYSGNGEGEILRYTTCAESGTGIDFCSLNLHLERTVGMSSMNYVVYIEEYGEYIGELVLTPDQGSLDTNLTFSSDKAVALYSSYNGSWDGGGNDFTWTVTDPFDHITELHLWEYYNTSNICAEQCELMLTYGSSRTFSLDYENYVPILQVYAGDSQRPYYEFGQNYWYEGDMQMVSIPVSDNVPLRFVWHDPDPENHSVWFSVFDTLSGFYVCGIEPGAVRPDGQIATYTPFCGTGCPVEKQCSTMVHLNYEPYNYEGHNGDAGTAVVGYSGGGIGQGEFVLTSENNYLDTTLLLCEDRPFSMWVKQGGDGMWAYIVDANGNETNLSDWFSYSTSDPCAQHCMLALRIGAEEQLSNIANPNWLQIYSGETEIFGFYADSWNPEVDYGRLYQIPLTASNEPLRFVWSDPDSEQHSSYLFIRDEISGVFLFQKEPYTTLENGVALEYTPSCELEPVYTREVYDVDVTTANVTIMVNAESFENYNYEDEVTYGVCYGTSPRPVYGQSNSYSRYENGMGNGYWADFDIANLSPSTTYYVRAFATYNGETYYGNELSFTTNSCFSREDQYESVCDTFLMTQDSYLMTEDFESEYSGWTTVNRDGDGTNWSMFSGYSSSGNYSMSSYAYQAQDNWLISPAITVMDDGSMTTFSWWASNYYGYSGVHYEVYVLTSPEINTIGESVFTDNPTNTSFQQHSIDLNDYAGQTVYVAFRHLASRYTYYLLLDKIEVKQTVVLETLTQSGDYTYIQPNQYGCMDTLVLHLTVRDNKPAVRTDGVYRITVESAYSGGWIDATCESEISECGLCYSTTPNPTIENNRVVSDQGQGSNEFHLTLNGLEEGTTYYVRAYATNAAGTSYGEERSFTTRYRANLSGTVYDGTTHEPIAGAYVSIYEYDNYNYNYNFITTVLTDANGQYAVGGLMSQSYQLKSTASGYNAYNVFPSLTSGDNICNVNIYAGTCQTVENLHYKLISGEETSLQLTWDMGENFMTQMGNSGYNNSWYPGADYSVGVYHLFTPADLANNNYNGKSIHSVGAWFPQRYEQVNYTIRIWTGGTEEDGPQTLAYEQQVNSSDIVGNAWSYIPLNTPFTFDGTQCLWIGFQMECHNTSGNWVEAIWLNNPNYGNNAHGHVLHSNNVWNVNPQLNVQGNWMIRAKLISNAQSYDILANGEAIATHVEGTTYTVSPYNPQQGEICYQVVTNCLNGRNSDTSACATVLQTPPVVHTQEVTNIGRYAATFSGELVSDGNSDIRERGFCWSTTPHPTKADYYNSIRTGNFELTYSNFSPQTTYYVRAYAINSIGTAYGNEVTFTTRAECQNPSSLTVSDVAASSALISWGSRSYSVFMNYELSYKANGETDWTVRNLTDEYYMLTGLTPNTTYAVRVRAICEEDNVSEYTEKSFTTECVSGTEPVVVGTGTSTNSGANIPLKSYYNYSYSQQIYDASELNGAQTIDHLQLQYNYNQANTWNVDIYLGHTTKSSFSSTSASNWVPYSDLELVYSGNITFDNSGENYWFDISLDTTFEYNGDDNLVVVFDNNTGSYPYPLFCTHSVSQYKSMIAYSDNTNFAPSAMSTGGNGRYYYRNNLRIPGMCFSEGCERANVAVRGVTDSSATLMIAAAGSNAYELQYAVAGSDSYTTIENTTSEAPYVLKGLRQNTGYEVRIRSLCANDSSDWKTASFTTGVKRLERLYVKAQGTGDGSSWNEATNDPAWALNTAWMISQSYGITPDVWVAEGVYYGNTTDYNAFTLENNSRLYGGFAGNENSLEERNIAEHLTILDGQNSRRVLYKATYGYNNDILVLDGLTIRNGNSGEGAGAWLYGPFEVRNCDFMNNRSSSSGGAVYMYREGTFRNCRFMDNTASNEGAVYDYSHYANFFNCKFSGNRAEYYGVLYGGRKLVNCEISGNTANYGAGVYNVSDSLINCNIVNNESQYENYAALADFHGVMINTVVWGNKEAGAVSNISSCDNMTVVNSAVEGGLEGYTGVICLQHDNIGDESGLYYPVFVSPEIGDYRLQNGSALIDAGTSNVAAGSVDLAGMDRVYGSSIDIGCYESHGEVYCSRPYHLAVQEVTGNAAMLTWQNSNADAPDYYELSYKEVNASDWTVVSDEIHDTYYMLSGLQQQTAYAVRIRTFCDASAGSFAYSEVLNFNTQCADQTAEAVIGEGSTRSVRYLPVDFYYNSYSYSQQIYKASEIGEARTIDHIMIQYFNVASYTRDVEIYLGHTNKSAFSTGYDWVLDTALTKVYDGSLTFVNTGENYWLDIPLNQPFAYNGTQNLVVMFYDKTGTYNYDYGDRFYVHYTTENDCIYSSGSVLDFSNLVYGNYTTIRNNLWIPGGCLPDACPQANVVVENVTDSSALVIFTAAPGSDSYELEYKESGSDSYESLTATSPYNWTGLKQNTEYELRIRSLCGDTAYSHWKTVSFTTPAKNLKRLYVTQTGTGDASSWQHASNNLVWTLNLAQVIKQQFGSAPEIWVAEGTYYGDSVSYSAFTMVEGVNVYGGFAGDETELSQRDYNGHLTILDGQNSQRVLFQESDFTQRTLWDGFVMQHGYVNYSNYDGAGGGAYLRAKASLSHCQLLNNAAQNGGGVYLYSGYSDSSYQPVLDSCIVMNNTAQNGGGVWADYAQLRNCTISYNTSQYDGGGVRIYYSIVDHCIVSHNNSSYSYGGGVYIARDYNTEPSVSNCLIAYNTAYNGGGIYSGYYSRIDNTTIVNNQANNGAGAFFNNSNQSYNVVNNCVVWGNYQNNGTVSNLYNYPTFYHSAVEGGVEGNTEVIALESANYGSESGLNYPFFVSPDNDDYRLRAGSALINAGMTLDDMPATDLAGEVRVYGDTVDIGCYESHDEDYCTEPVALAVQDIVGSSAMITWRNSNMNEPLYYQLSYKSEGATAWTTLPEQIHTDYYLLSGLSPQTSYSVRVSAVCDEDNISPNAETSFSTACLNGAQEVIVGQTTSTNAGSYLPTSIYHNYSYTQQIYLIDEIGGARTIDTIYLQYFYGTPYTRNIDIYLGHTDKSSFVSSNDWVAKSNLTKVYSGNITFNNLGENYWFAIPLSTPFEYYGTANLVVAFDDNTGSYSNSSDKFYTHTTSANRSMYYCSDGTNVDPNSPINASAVVSYRNNLWIPGTCINEGCDRANVSIREVTSNSALLHFVAGEGATGMQMEYCEAGTENYIVLPTVSSPYQLTGLRQNTEYELRVRSLCGNDSSRWMKKNFRTGVLNLDRLYVTTTGTGNGSSWNDAAGSIAWTLDVAQLIKETYGTTPEIWVAQGTYYGDSISDNAFTMVEGVNVYGGFAGDEAENYDLSQRDFDAHATILDGQSNQRVLYQPNNFRRPTTWDGFTIQNGLVSNNYSYNSQHGGGAWLRGGSTLNHCTIINNSANRYGGGVYCSSDNNTDSICLLNSSVSYNSSHYAGGGIYFSSKVVADNCLFTHNISSSEGGGVYDANYGDNASVLYNCLVANNTSSSNGGGILSTGWYSRIVNTTIVNNKINNSSSGYQGAGVYSHNSLYLYNCIIWGNQTNGMVNGLSGSYTANHIASDDGGAGENNIVLLSGNSAESILAPRFVKPSLTVGAADTTSHTDWHLSQGSPCVNHGDNSMATAYDLAGNDRVQQGVVDLGCYESPYTGVELPIYDSIIYVKPNGAGTRTGESWDNAIASVQDAVSIAAMYQARVWVAAGTYYGDGSSENAFMMKPGVNVYGGFAGNEEPDFDLSQRNFEDYPSILDGQNAQRVLVQPVYFSENTAVVWDGFTIRNGRVRGNGAGVCMLAYSSLRNCVVRNNTVYNPTTSSISAHGAGVYAVDDAYSNYTITISHCVISHNAFNGMYRYDDTYGAGIYARYANIDHTEISYNSGSEVGGGLLAQYVNASNCLIHHNTSLEGGGLYLYGNCQFVNCDIVSNTVTDRGGGIYDHSYNTAYTNCIIWGNKKNFEPNNFDMDNNSATFTYCAVEGGMEGDHNLELASSNDGFDGTQNYVRFSDPVNEDFRLHPSSSCINVGNTEAMTDSVDFYGNRRLIGDFVDIGCSEVQEESSCVSVINLTVSNITTNSANLSWHPMGTESQWLVVYGEVDGDLLQMTVDDTLCHLTGLTLNRNYMAKVRAICGENMSSIFSVTVNFQTDCNPDQLDTLPNFSNLMPANHEIIYNKKVSFSWATMEHATSYDFYLWKETESEPSTPTLSGLGDPNVMNYTLPNHEPGTVFNWKVVAWNECIHKTSEVMAIQVNWNPDLHVSAVSTSTPVMSTQPLTVTWTVTNDGQGNTPPGVTWNDYIWISPVDGVGGGFWYNVAEKLLAVVPNQQTLMAGESYTNSVQVTLPAGDEYIGNYYLFVFTDQHDGFIENNPNVLPDPYTPSISGDPYPYLTATHVQQHVSQVAEDNDDDNFFYKLFEILPPPSPDLQVSSIVHSDMVLSGQETNVTWTVTNDGEANAEGIWTDAVYLSSDTLLDTEEDYRVGRFVHSEVLPIGESYQKTAQFTVPVDFDGDYYFFVLTDFNNNLYEGLKEINNRTRSSVMRVNMNWFTDLVVTSDTIPDALNVNGRYTYSYVLENQGMNPTNVNRWIDVVYISREPILNRNTAIKLATMQHSSVLNHDEASTMRIPILIPDTISGTWYLHVETDARNDVFEYSVEGDNVAEYNNVYTHPQALTVLQPDLTVSDITLPDVVNPNEPVRIQWTVRNVGPGALINRYFKDNIYCNNQLLYSANANNVSIPAGDAIVRTATVRLPCVNGGVAPLTITTDVENRVPEVSKTNNTTTVTLNFSTPDLAVSAVTPLQTLTNLNNGLWSGAPAELSYTVTNHGELMATHAAMVDKIYFSASANSYQEENLIYSNTHEMNLGVEESETYTCTVTLPNGVSGNYYYHVVCNADAILCENGAMSDNEGVSEAVEVQLSPSPDLVITKLETPSQVYLGASFGVSYTIKNQGIAPLNNTRVQQRFYYAVSDIAGYDTINRIATISDYLNLGVNDSVTLFAQMTLPVNLQVRNYYIYAVTDANDQIYEHEGEENNVKVSGAIEASRYQLDLQLTEIEGPEVMQWGQTATFKLHVSNISSLPTLAASWQDVIYLSADDVFQNSDRLMQAVSHSSEVEAGASYVADVQVTIPYGTTSPAYLIGITDINNANPETDISNNVIFKQLTINPVQTPDLAVSEAVLLDEVKSGQPARIAYKVTNVGEIDIQQQTWNDKLFVSYNNSYENNDLQLLTKDRRNMTLAQGEFYRDTLTFTVPLPYNGDMYLLLMANAVNNPYESIQDNNMAAVPVSVVLPLPGDLVVTGVSCEDSVMSGQMLHASWTIQNIGDNALTGDGLRSLVYVSADTVFDANDRLLGRVTTNQVNLGVDAIMQQQLSARVNGLAAGNYYLIVKIDVTNAFNEVSDDNNTGYSVDPFAVTIRPLRFNTDEYDTVGNNEVSDYMLAVGDQVNQTVRVHISSEDSARGAVNMIYATYNGMGSNLNYSYATVGQYTANPELYIPATQQGFYGVNIYGSTPTNQPQNMIVRADILPFELRAINDNHGGNTGVVTVELTGSRFRPDMTVSLSKGNEVIVADTLIYVNYYQAFVKFDLTGRTPGVYNVNAVNLCDGSYTLADAFTIEDGQPSGLAYNLLFPSSPRPNRNIVMMLEYGNIGNVDLHNQVLEITSLGHSPISLTPEGISQNRIKLQVPLSIEGEPEGLLRPGSYGTINIYTYSSGALIFTIKPVEE